MVGVGNTQSMHLSTAREICMLNSSLADILIHEEKQWLQHLLVLLVAESQGDQIVWGEFMAGFLRSICWLPHGGGRLSDKPKEHPRKRLSPPPHF